MKRLFDKNARRNGVTQESFLWPDKTLKFFISDDFSGYKIILTFKFFLIFCFLRYHRETADLINR